MRLFTLLFLAFPVIGFAQGPLVPPGAPAPTMKTLDQIEPRVPISSLPFTITSPGSYFLTGNLSGTADTIGITIDADNVTLDLGGFELVGNGGTHGVRLINGHLNTTVFNGTLRDWTGSGFSVAIVTSAGVRVENLHVGGCGIGISLGSNGTATGCHVRGNNGTGTGISGGDGCKVIDCTAIANSGAGIKLGSNAVVTACVTAGNASNGIEVVRAGSIQNCSSSGNFGAGIVGGDAVSIGHCSAYGNTSFGIGAENGGVIHNSSATGNTGTGIATLASCTITDCSSSSNLAGGISTANAANIRGCNLQSNSGGNGINTLEGSTISHCNVRGSTHGAGSSSAISTGAECLVSDCLVTDTGSSAGSPNGAKGAGISVDAGSTVNACTVRDSKGDGIRATNRCRITANHCSRSGDNGNGNGTGGDGAGIHIYLVSGDATTSLGNHIQGNTVIGNDRGIDVDGRDNFIIQNTSADNTLHFVLVANNRFGPILDISAIATAATTGGASVTSGLAGATDPHSNFNY